MAECHPVGFQWVMEARNRGAKVIHVDPRFTRTSAVATQHVAIRPGSDIAFLGGIINYIMRNERYFKEYVVHYTSKPLEAALTRLAKRISRIAACSASVSDSWKCGGMYTYEHQLSLRKAFGHEDMTCASQPPSDRCRYGGEGGRVPPRSSILRQARDGESARGAATGLTPFNYKDRASFILSNWSA